MTGQEMVTVYNSASGVMREAYATEAARWSSHEWFSRWYHVVDSNYMIAAGQPVTPWAVADYYIVQE